LKNLISDEQIITIFCELKPMFLTRIFPVSIPLSISHFTPTVWRCLRLGDWTLLSKNGTLKRLLI